MSSSVVHGCYGRISQGGIQCWEEHLRASHLDLGLAKGNVLVYNAPTCLTQPSDTFTTRPVNLKHQISCSPIDVKYSFSHPLSPIFLANSPLQLPSLILRSLTRVPYSSVHSVALKISLLPTTSNQLPQFSTVCGAKANE